MNYEDKLQARKSNYLKLSEKAKSRSQDHSEQGVKLLEQYPYGQPILVGHHSE